MLHAKKPKVSAVDLDPIPTSLLLKFKHSRKNWKGKLGTYLLQWANLLEMLAMQVVLLSKIH